MKVVDLYARVRRACHVEGMSRRQAARVFGIDPKTVAKMLRFSVPPGYRRSKPAVRPKLDPLAPVIDRILEEDQGRPRKQQHTARRIFERLRVEHGFAGGETIVKDYVRERRLRGQEVFVPLVHPPGHGQADFGEAVAVIGGEEQRIHFLAVILPHSDACFVRAYPAERSEAFCDGHNAAFAFFGGVPRSMLNTRVTIVRGLDSVLYQFGKPSDTGGDFACHAARAAKRDVRVGAIGRPPNQAVIRSRLMAAAVATCCRPVLARPR
jgi:transposase